jgi:hypothetical protein
VEHWGSTKKSTNNVLLSESQDTNANTPAMFASSVFEMKTGDEDGTERASHGVTTVYNVHHKHSRRRLARSYTRIGGI